MKNNNDPPAKPRDFQIEVVFFKAGRIIVLFLGKMYNNAKVISGNRLVWNKGE